MSDLELLYRVATFDSDLAALQRRADADPSLLAMLVSLIDYVRDNTEIDDADDVPDDIRETIEEHAIESYMAVYSCECCAEEFARGLETGRNECECRAEEFERGLEMGRKEAAIPEGAGRVPEVGSFHGWKKLADGVLAHVLIPADAERVGGSEFGKCRASKVITLDLWDRSGVRLTDPTARHAGTYRAMAEYQCGEETVADNYDPDPTQQCTGGIHFFLTRQEALDYHS